MQVECHCPFTQVCFARRSIICVCRDPWGVCRNHIGGRAFIRKALKVVYYWLNALQEARGLPASARGAKSLSLSSMAPIRAHIDDNIMVIGIMESWPCGTIASKKGRNEVFSGCHWLFHQVGWSWGSSSNHYSIHHKVSIEDYFLLVWHPSKHRLKQGASIQLGSLSRVVWTIQNPIQLFFA